MTEEKLWLLVSLQLSGEATPAELEELNVLVQQDPLAAERVAVLRDIWMNRTGNDAGVNKAMSFDKHLQRLGNYTSTPVLQFDDNYPENQPMQQNRQISFRRAWWMGSGIAASILGLFVIMRTGEIKNWAR